MTLSELGGWPAVLGPLLDRHDLTAEQARAAMQEILAGDATPAQLAAFVVALRVKGETVEELTGMLGALLDAAEVVELPREIAARALDVVGTGGDRSHSVNVSTMAALVVAAAGVPVCKHGNRAASSRCGSADLLEALGVPLDLGPSAVARLVGEVGFGFCFAPRFHPALRHAGPPRRELGVPTAFNLLGPLANPARVRRYLLGVGAAGMVEKVAGVLAATGAQRAFVVRGDDGLDEITTTTTTQVIEIAGGSVVDRWVLDPRAHGIRLAGLDDLRGGDPAANAAIARAVLAGQPGPARDVVLLNAAVALMAAGVADGVDDGLERAAEAVDDGRAAGLLEHLVAAAGAGRPAGS